MKTGQTTKKINPIRRFIAWLPELSRYTFVLYTAITLTLCAIMLISFNHVLIKSLERFDWLGILLGLLLGILILFIALRGQKSKPNAKHKDITYRQFKKFMIIATIVLFVAQLILLFGRFFVAGGDVAKIMFKFGDEQYYFDMYPNNMFMHGAALKVAAVVRALNIDDAITSIFSNFYPAILDKIAEMSVSHPDYLSYAITYAIFTFVGIVATCVSVVFITMIIQKKVNNKFAVFAFIVSGLFIGLSPGILVPYSDIYALFFVTTILGSYYGIKNRAAKLSVITAATIIGFNIKPTICFCLIAILFIEICNVVTFSKEKIKTGLAKNKQNIISNYVVPALAIFVSAALCFGLVAFIKQIDIKINEEKQMTKTHFLMMGLNPETKGFFSETDVDFSQQFSSIEERESANIQEIQNRISSLGPAGLAQLFAEKSIINYGDGTFQGALDAGPEFYYFEVGKNPIITAIINNDYPFRATVGFCILFGCILAAIIKRDKLINITSATLLMLSVFLMIFESGSRYLILYTPYFMIMGLLGGKNLYNICFAKFINRLPNKQPCKQCAEQK